MTDSEISMLILQHIKETFGAAKDIADSYVVNDDVEIGFGNKIPLWLFGFLY